jgi:hypothetical protein
MQPVFTARPDNRDWYPSQYKSLLNKYLAWEIAKFRHLGKMVYHAPALLASDRTCTQSDTLPGGVTIIAEYIQAPPKTSHFWRSRRNPRLFDFRPIQTRTEIASGIRFTQKNGSYRTQDVEMTVPVC